MQIFTKMNKEQIAQLNSFQTTQLVLENGILIWQGNAAFADNVKEFNETVADIFNYKNLQLTDLGGARTYKEKARLTMADKSIKIRSAVQNFASDADNSKLYKEINFPKSKLQYGDQQKVLAYASKVESLARKNVASLAPYKVLPADVDAFLELIDNFKAAIPMVVGVRTGTKNATAQLAVLCKKAREIIETKLRKGATQFMDSAPDFYNELLNSFRIDKLPTHFTEFDMVLVNKVTQDALSGVKVTAVSSKGEMIQFSNPIGEVDFIQFEPGYWNLTFELPGFNKITKTAVKAELGKKLELGTVELVPVL